MDIKEQAHQYLINKGCLSVGQTYTAFQVERMLTEFAQEQVKLFCQPVVIGSVCPDCNGTGVFQKDQFSEIGCVKCMGKGQTDL